MTAARLVVAAFLIGTASAAAQPPSTADIDAKIHERWPAILAEVARERGMTIAQGRPQTADAAARRAVYAEAIARLIADEDLVALAAPDLSLVTETTRQRDRTWLAQLKQHDVEAAQANSIDSASTNPAAGQLTERSGFTDFLALALRGQNIFSADQNAVSVNLNALALVSLKDPEVYSELYRYQQHALLRRVGGTVVFGAKIPEKEITGISGFPDANKLLDVFTWDVKVRVLGDRDPRSSQWYGLTLGTGGLLTQLTAVLPSDVPIEDLAVIRDLLNDALGRGLQRIVARIKRSPQLAVKTSGTHLTQEKGRNKYTAAVLFDVGMGGTTDLTANVLYSIVDDVRLGADQAFQIKQVNANASVSARLARDAIVKGRSMEWTSGTTVTMFTNKASLPIPVKDTWKLFSGLDIPVGDAAKIPISVVYTNDKNALEKTQYFTGQVGISYDFSALKKLFAK